MIKTDSTLSDSKIILLSSNLNPRYSPEIVDACLTKPVSPSLLLMSLNRLLAKADPAAGDFVRRGAGRNPPPPWRQNIRVLVVEDNLTNQILIKEQLGVLGYTAHIVADATGALGAIDQSRYDVILMDCELPGMSGYEATTEIRRREGNRRQLKIIALTAHVTEHQKQRCLDAGMDGYLSKPARLQTLADTLDAACQTSAGRDEGSTVELDPTVLAEIGELSIASGRNIFRDLVDNFLLDLSPRVKLLKAALESSNMNALALVAHPLRSASAIVGAKQFSDICATIERYARDGKVDQASSLTRELLAVAQVLPDALLASVNYK